ncbi:MAG: hypothetical protein J4469_01025 [Candidatus Aenigmarchaeota archaeon]|nr:hypothetical protein [Candidatus Aenigmarchaeota archaeon]
MLFSMLYVASTFFSSENPTSPAAADLVMEIGIYQARFSNTGVKAYRVPAGFE